MIWLFFLCNLLARASAGPLTLDGAIQRGMQNNPSLEKAKESLAVAQAKSWETLATYSPKVLINASHSIDEKYLTMPFGAMRIPATTPKTFASVGAYLTLFDGLQGWHNHQATEKQTEVASLEYSRAQQQTESEIRTAFYRTLGTNLLVEVNQQSVTALKDHLAKTQQTLQRGVSTKFDMLRVQVQLEEAESELLRAQDQYTIALRQLSNAMGEESAEWGPQGEFPEPTILTDAEEKEWRKRQSVDTKTSLLKAEAADYNSLAANGTYLPKINFYAEQQYYNTDTHGLTDHYYDAYGVGFNLSWPIFDFALISRNRAQAHLADESAALARELHLRSLGEEENWFRQLRYSATQYQAKKRALESASEEFRLAKIGFTAGSYTNSQVLDAQVDVTRAKAGILRAQIDNREALGKLEAMFGRNK